MCGDMSLLNIQGPLLHSGDILVQCILTVEYTFIMLMQRINTQPELELYVLFNKSFITYKGLCRPLS